MSVRGSVSSISSVVLSPPPDSADVLVAACNTRLMQLPIEEYVQLAFMAYFGWEDNIFQANGQQYKTNQSFTHI